MLKLPFFLYFLLIRPIYCQEWGNFSRKVSSKAIFPVCQYDKKKGDETGIFFIDYKEMGVTHTFLILRGIVPDTCKRLERESLRLKKENSFLFLSGSSGSYDPVEKNITWFWKSLKSRKGCVSYFVHECQ